MRSCVSVYKKKNESKHASKPRVYFPPKWGRRGREALTIITSIASSSSSMPIRIVYNWPLLSNVRRGHADTGSVVARQTTKTNICSHSNKSGRRAPRAENSLFFDFPVMLRIIIRKNRFFFDLLVVFNSFG